MSANASTIFWQDREIRFDSNVEAGELNLRKGEFEIDVLENVEDTKGNNGEKGRCVITNLRLIWICSRNPKINLSIGYNTMVNIKIQTGSSRLKGSTQALYLLTKYHGSRFEFIFSNMVKSNPRLFSTIQAVFKAYQSSKMYREIRLRSAIIKNKHLDLLPKEQVYTTLSGVWNLSAEQGNLGTFIVTNVRVVWFADLAENFNVSIPFLQIKNVSFRDSKFGKAFVIETNRSSGREFVLGFKVDPLERLNELFKEVSSLHQLFTDNPILGVEYQPEEKQASLEQLMVPKTTESIKYVGNKDTSDPLAPYYIDSSDKSSTTSIGFSEELGLACEELKDGMTIKKLWQCIYKV
ncbi:hypothetical protein FDP41_001925 [Naegleria fowleri]|uniref:BBSome complex member BBS5 PH domain-containing protein n=1 Tax=Naegleria fowleri TaxID=5763 RepID=A0A6A5BZV8_NAEFO|nr:uncharacterized protein FDP41_001925 [Naegleria fowleri]KAF0978855.1 hypothetical protein FDP41_001925 [Naegleria fowleri]